ncbi:unnamed protein product [Rhizoctonia solani]|nr:unnamed protein product [Rhizoctonia solani]
MFISLANGFNEIGIRMGLAFAIIGFAALIGTPIAGALLGPELTWWRPIVFSGIIVLAGCTMLTIARGLQARRKRTMLP